MSGSIQAFGACPPQLPLSAGGYWKAEGWHECLGILCLAVSEPEAVFEVIDGALDGYANHEGRLPFLCSTDRYRIMAEILFRIKVDHVPVAGSGTRIVAMTNTVVFSMFAFVIAHFWTDELEGFQAAALMGGVSFLPHGEGWIMGTEGYAFLIDCVIRVCLHCVAVHRDKSLGKDPCGAILFVAEHIAT